MGMDSDFPPGFRFHPTDEELVLYYLKRKICCKRHHSDVIGETDVYKFDPEELPSLSKLRTRDRQWFFFCPRDRKYPNGSRSNRATSNGYWKATGKDRIISCGSRTAGTKKTLVFYRGRAPKGERTDWVMHEYTMHEEELKRCEDAKECYALYKVFKKSGPGPQNGAQYGALFREEDLDNEDQEVQPLSGKSVDEQVPVNEIMGVNGEYLSSLDDLKEFMDKLADEPITSPPQLQFGNDGYIWDCVQQDVAESNIVGNSAIEVSVPVPQTFTNIDLWQTETTYMNADVSSAPVFDVSNGVPAENGDFLEINDLLGPTDQVVGHPDGVVYLDELDGLTSLDFQDASSILFDDEMNESHMLLQDGFDYLGYNSSATSTISTSNHQEQLQFSNLNAASYIHDREDGHDITLSSTPGFVHENQTFSHIDHHTTGVDESRTNQLDDGNNSWLYSAIMSYLDSIPTTPASASESTLVNRAFVRMSSFSRLRRNANVVAGNNALPSSGKARSNVFMLFVSLLVVLCAVSWMFLANSVRFSC